MVAVVVDAEGMADMVLREACRTWSPCFLGEDVFLAQDWCSEVESGFKTRERDGGARRSWEAT